jgi:hypothetical protein
MADVDDDHHESDPREQWSLAVASIYFHGRRKLNPTVFTEEGLPFEFLPLESCVDTLVGTTDPASITSVRLALADLCRNRPNFDSDATVAEMIRKLAIRYGELVGVDKPADIARGFLVLGSAAEADHRYGKALELLYRHAGTTDRTRINFTDYKMARRDV